MLKTSHFRPNPAWGILHRGQKTIWGNFKTGANDSYFERNEITECPRKLRQPTSIGITWHIQLFSTQSARSVFFESDHARMFGCFSVWMMWTGNSRDVLWFTETFQSLATISSFILEFFLFPHCASLFLVKLNYGFLGCNRFLVCCSHCALNHCVTTSNTLLCRHVYVWSDCGHADSTWRKVPWCFLQEKHRSESIYSQNFRLVAFGRRSYVERRRNDITSGSIAIKDFRDNSIGSISFYFVQAHCLAWVTAVAVLCSSPNILTSSLTMSLFPFGPTLENTLLLGLPSPARLVWVTPIMSLIRWLHSGSWTALTTDHFVPNFISGYAFWLTSSAESFIIIWRRNFPILNFILLNPLNAR